MFGMGQVLTFVDGVLLMGAELKTVMVQLFSVICAHARTAQLRFLRGLTYPFYAKVHNTLKSLCPGEAY